MKNNEALLSIHYYFPPIHSIGVVRNYHITRQLTNQINNHLILTTSNKDILAQDDSFDISGMNIIAAQTKDYRTKYANGTTHFKEDKKSGFIKQIGIKLINSYPFNVRYGEGGKKYVDESIKIGTAFLSKNPNAIIYSSFRPYTDIYIGYCLKKEFPKAKWVVDFRDLHCDPVYKNVFLSDYQKRNNKKILQHADLITTVSGGLKHHLEKYEKEILVAYNGIEVEEKPMARSDKFTLNYTGSLFGAYRDPSILLKILKSLIDEKLISLSDIQFSYAGKDGAKFMQYLKEFRFDDLLINHGMVSREASLNLQRSANINLLLTSANSEMQGVLTGKLFEYIAALRPIIAVVKGTKDNELESILSTPVVGQTLYSNTNIEEAKHWILEKYEMWKSNKEEIVNKENVLRKFSWQQTAKKIYNAVSDV